MLKTIKYIALLILLVQLSAYSKGNLTPFSITAGGNLNGVMYKSDFKNLPGIENCCSRFTDAFRLTYDVHAGLEYRFSLFDIPSALDLSFAFSDLSANYNQTYAFANIITGNTYTKGTSEYILEPDIKALFIEPGIYLSPFAGFPLSFRLGFAAGMLTGKTFHQEEKLVSPENAYFENGSKVRGAYTGPIPDAASNYYAVSVGLRYKAADIGNFSIYPEIRFNYGMSDMVQGLSWRANTLQAGVTVAFNIPKASGPPPMNPPMPDYPEPPQPPAPSIVQLNLDVDINGEKQQKDSTYIIPVTEHLTTLSYSLLPIIFYDENSTNPIGDNASGQTQTDDNIGEVNAQNNLIKAIAKLMTDKPELKVNIISSSFDTEDVTIADSRINSITDELISNGVSVARINISKKVLAKEDVPKPELIPESTYIRFELSDGTKLIPYSESSLVKREYPELTMNVKPEIITTSDIKIFRGDVIGYDTIGFDIKGISTSINDRAEFQIRGGRNNFNFYSDITIRAAAENQDGTKASETFSLRFNTLCSDTIITQNPLDVSDSKTSQYILCFFDYDRSEVKIINENVAALVRKAISDGKKVTFLAQTDNLGTENYNSDLAIKRGRKAMELFNGNSGKITVTQPNHYIFSNDTPIGRMLNRSVVVRITD